jgi:hypothetical protein
VFTNPLINHSRTASLVTVVILSAFVSTLIAQQWFEPEPEDTVMEDTVGEDDLTQLHQHLHARTPPE